VNDWVKEQFEKPIETRSAPALEKSTVSKKLQLTKCGGPASKT
jgi:hypothetical protein